MTPFFAPQNFKKGRLIASKYRKIDIAIVVISILIFLPLMLIVLTNKDMNNLLLIPLGIPILVCITLVQPFHIYHNFLVYIDLVISYFSRIRVYKWEGICKYEEKPEHE